MALEILSVTDIVFCHFGPFFAHSPSKNPKNQNFEKMKKMPGDFIILHKCTKNHDHNHTVPEIWHMTMYYFSFWAIFCPFTPLTAQKIKISKNEKNT